MQDPTFTFCGTFSGKGTISASRWIEKLEFELTVYKINGVIPSVRFMTSIDLLLTDDAAQWAEINPDAARLLSLSKPTAKDVTTFKGLFQERFPAKSSIEISTVSFDQELQGLQQNSQESVAFYYRRATAMMARIGARDRAVDLTNTLSLLESAMLDIIIEAFIRGLDDPDIRRETIKGLGIVGRSLRGACTVAEEAVGFKEKLRKFLDEGSQSKELLFYKELVQRNMDPGRISTRLAEFKSHPDPAQWAYESSAVTPAVNPLTDRANNNQSPYRPSFSPAMGTTQAPAATRRPFKPNPAPKDLPSNKVSRNKYINGTALWDEGDDAPCIKCGETGHVARGHITDKTLPPPLPVWEKSYLRTQVFEDAPPAYFCEAGYGQYDECTKPYETHTSSSSKANTPSTESYLMSGDIPSDRYGKDAHSVTLGICEDEPEVEEPVSRSQGSGEKKRPHLDHAATEDQPMAAADPAKRRTIPFNAGAKTGNKGAKRVEEQTKPQSLVDIFNDLKGTYDTPISVRQMLQQNKVDYMDGLNSLVTRCPQRTQETMHTCNEESAKSKNRAAACASFSTHHANPWQHQSKPDSCRTCKA